MSSKIESLGQGGVGSEPCLPLPLSLNWNFGDCCPRPREAVLLDRGLLWRLVLVWEPYS
jgi:hypothetical protein